MNGPRSIILRITERPLSRLRTPDPRSHRQVAMRCSQSSCAIIGRLPELRRRCAEAHAKSNRAKDKSLSQRRRSCASCSLGVPPQRKHKINQLASPLPRAAVVPEAVSSAPPSGTKPPRRFGAGRIYPDRFLPMTPSPHSFGRTEFSAPQTHAGANVAGRAPPAVRSEERPSGAAWLFSVMLMANRARV